MGRKYQLKQRAEDQEETRRRIIEATIELHQAVGDAATISAIADRAGVGRVTVYRHFPDERALLSACTSHYFAANPPPDPVPWADITDPAARFQTALGSLYAYYRDNAAMLARAEQDAPDNPVLAELLAPFLEYQATMQEILIQGWTEEEEPAGPLFGAAIGHALAFSSWHSLVREQGLGDAQAISLMLGLARYALSLSRVHVAFAQDPT